MKIGDLCDFKTNFVEADFWLIRKGDEKSVGKPTKDFNSEYIGVKVRQTELVLPSYLFFYFQYIHSTGAFTKLATGSLNLKNIKISDIKEIPIVFR